MANPARNVAAEMAMPHLASTEDLKKAVDAEFEEPTKDDSAPDPRDEREWSFNFAFKDRRGKSWSGQFTNKILDFEHQQRVAVMTADFNGRRPIESLPETIAELNGFVAHMTYSLSAARPEWAKDLRKLEDFNLILALWKEVSSHEARYFRLGEDPVGGASAE